MNNDKYIIPTTLLLTSIIFMLISDNYAINFLAGFCISLTIIHLYLTYVDDKLLYETKISRSTTLLKCQFLAEIVTLIFVYKFVTPDTNLLIIGMLTGTILLIALIQLKRRVGN